MQASRLNPPEQLSVRIQGGDVALVPVNLKLPPGGGRFRKPPRLQADRTRLSCNPHRVSAKDADSLEDFNLDEFFGGRPSRIQLFRVGILHFPLNYNQFTSI